FFSSRRRHTRFSRDWSSDVCSSDLDISEVPKRKLISERLPLEESTVPEDAVYGVAQLLLRMAQRRQAEMARYRYIRAVDEEEDEIGRASCRERVVVRVGAGRRVGDC